MLRLDVLHCDWMGHACTGNVLPRVGMCVVSWRVPCIRVCGWIQEGTERTKKKQKEAERSKRHNAVSKTNLCAVVVLVQVSVHGTNGVQSTHTQRKDRRTKLDRKRVRARVDQGSCSTHATTY